MRNRQKQPIINKKYQLVGRRLGEGGLSRVFQAQDIETGERVAAKHTIASLKKSELVSELSRNQIKTLLRLKGAPHVLQIRDYFEWDGKCFIVTELCKGGTLASFLKKRSFTYETMLRIIRDLLKGYIQINKLEIIHRDLKPSNILFTHEGDLKIADFGFATTFQDLAKEQTLSIGSELYMPPESLSNYEYSPKSDIWAIGVIIYQTLFGKLPWKEKSKPRIYQKILFQPISTLFPKGTQEWAKNLLQRALDPAAKNRATAQELLALVPYYYISDIKLLPNPKLQQSQKKERQQFLTISTPTQKNKHTKEDITKLLLQQINYSRLQYQMHSLLLKLTQNNPLFSKFVATNNIDDFLLVRTMRTLNYIQEITYDVISDQERNQYKLSEQYQQIVQIVEDYRKKYGKDSQYFHCQGLRNIDQDDSINQILVWLNQNVKKESSYEIFVFYDYLITLKWLYQIEIKEGIKEILEVNVGELVLALRKESKAKDKIILEDYLKQLTQKLEQLHVLVKT